MRERIRRRSVGWLVDGRSDRWVGGRVGCDGGGDDGGGGASRASHNACATRVLLIPAAAGKLGQRRRRRRRRRVPISPTSTTADFAFATADTGDITADEITLLRGLLLCGLVKCTQTNLRPRASRRPHRPPPSFSPFFLRCHLAAADADESF